MCGIFYLKPIGIAPWLNLVSNSGPRVSALPIKPITNFILLPALYHHYLSKQKHNLFLKSVMEKD